MKGFKLINQFTQHNIQGFNYIIREYAESKDKSNKVVRSTVQWLD